MTCFCFFLNICFEGVSEIDDVEQSSWRLQKLISPQNPQIKYIFSISKIESISQAMDSDCPISRNYGCIGVKRELV